MRGDDDEMDDGEMKEKKDGEMEKDDGEMKEKEKIKCKVLLLSRLEKKKKKKNDINKNNRMIYQN